MIPGRRHDSSSRDWMVYITLWSIACMHAFLIKSFIFIKAYIYIYPVYVFYIIILEEVHAFNPVYCIDD